MKTGIRLRVGFTAVALLFVAAWLIALTNPGVTASASPAAHVADEQTEDVIHLRDGRILRGKIISETRDQVRFQYIDPALNARIPLTFNKDAILHIERDVPVKGASGPDSEPARTPAPPPADRRQGGPAAGSDGDESLPSIYVIPMKGQMGTDIRLDVYESIIADIRARRPDVVVWVLDCSDEEDMLIPTTERDERGLFGEMVDDYRLMVQRLQDELRGIRQVMWVHDAYGIGSVMALAWPEMYMTPRARLVGMSWFFQEFGGDEDIKAKMREYWLAAGNSFLQRGGRSLELGYGLMDPRQVLSASWRGREVVWRNDLDGQYIVNANRRVPAVFRAKTAEDFRISKGTVEDLDDLAMLLGFREYRVIEGEARSTIDRYVTNWRRELENVWKRFGDYQQHMGWASGDQTIRWLGRARSDLEYIVQQMRRYPAIELRARMRGYPSRLALELRIEQIQQQIADLNRQGRGGSGRGGGGGGMGGRGGGW